MDINTQRHQSATASHYDNAADLYDAFNEERSAATNAVVEKALSTATVNKILDFACGTGSQVFYLSKKGYQVVGADINKKMLEKAQEKSKQQSTDFLFIEGDMRTTKVGSFDAVITIFNAVGHLTKEDFEQAMQNVYQNLNPDGLYIFDIFNLEYLLDHDNIKQLTIDWEAKKKDKVSRHIQYSTVTSEGVLASYTTNHQISRNGRESIKRSVQTLQVYNYHTLETMLNRAGFSVLKKMNINGQSFSSKNSQRLLIVARKRINST